MDEPEITELVKIDATRVDGVGTPASGAPILLMKSVDVEKDWAEWDAAHEGGGRGSAAAAGRAKGGDSKASAADAVARAKQTIADHKAGKKVSAADLKNAHEVHEAHLAHLARLKAEGKEPPKEAAKPKAPAKPAAKPAAGKPAAAKKGARDCPECDKSYDADHEGSTCENCGTKLPAATDAAKELVREILKAATRGKVDEAPDIAGGTAVLGQIADLIIAEAQELKSGQAAEISDIQQLACAAELIWTWRTGEESVAAGSVMPATALMQSAAAETAMTKYARDLFGLEVDELTTDHYREIIKQLVPKLRDLAKDRNYSAAERKEMAGDGRALPDGSYPINDEHDLNSAAILARSGHGDADAASKHIARRAKELGVANPLDDSAEKSQIAQEETDVDTVTQDGLSKAVEDAVTKALAASEERITALEAELAKVKALPVPGGPVMTRVQAPKAEDGEDHAAKAVQYDTIAEQLADPVTADAYRKLAAQHRAKITV